MSQTKRWKPTEGQKWWYIIFDFDRFDQVSYDFWRSNRDISCYSQIDGWKQGNCFRTRSEAISARKKVVELLLSL